MLKRILFFVLIGIFIILMSISGFYIIHWLLENHENDILINHIREEARLENTSMMNGMSSLEDNAQNDYQIDFILLKNQNLNTYAWLNVKGTNIDYPVVQATDNEYYLNHSFDNSYNGAGWVFMDYRNQADEINKNVVIYGHNRKDGSMFGTLKRVLTKDWQNNEENHIITLMFEDECKKYEVFSTYTIEVEDYYIQTNFENDKEFETFIKKMKDRSNHLYQVEVHKEDEILTLSTCSNTNYRVVLHAKLIKE